MVEPTTKVAPDESGAGAAPATQEATPPAGEEYFLEINDRTRYRTADDAKKAFSEAGERIAGLSNWEKLAQEYGVETPEELAQYFDELIELRSKGGKETTERAAGATPEATDTAAPQLTETDRKTLEYLEKKLGFPRSGSLEERFARMEKQLNSISQSSESAQRQSLIESGRSVVRDFMSQNGLPADNEKLTLRAERFIRAYLEDTTEFVNNREGESVPKPGSALARFWRGGSEQRAVLEEAFKEFLETIEFGRSSEAAGYRARKEEAMKKAPKSLPKGIPPASEGVKSTEKPKSFSEAHTPAWELFQKRLKETEATEE